MEDEISGEAQYPHLSPTQIEMALETTPLSLKINDIFNKIPIEYELIYKSVSIYQFKVKSSKQKKIAAANVKKKIISGEKRIFILFRKKTVLERQILEAEASNNNFFSKNNLNSIAVSFIDLDDESNEPIDSIGAYCIINDSDYRNKKALIEKYNFNNFIFFNERNNNFFDTSGICDFIKKFINLNDIDKLNLTELILGFSLNTEIWWSKSKVYIPFIRQRNDDNSLRSIQEIAEKLNNPDLLIVSMVEVSDYFQPSLDLTLSSIYVKLSSSRLFLLVQEGDAHDFLMAAGKSGLIVKRFKQHNKPRI